MEKKNTRQHTIALRSAAGTGYNAAEEQEDNIIGKRIAQARTSAGFSLAKLSTLLESYGIYVKASAISKWESGTNIPNAYQLVAISQALRAEDEISFYTKEGTKSELNDEGLKKVAEYKADLIASGRYKPTHTCIVRYIEMPVSRLAVSAGTGQFLDDGNFEMISFPESSVPNGADFGLRVSGDSMEPVYQDGQIIWVKQCERVAPGDIGIFICNGEGYVKLYHEQEPSENCREDFTDSYGVVRAQPVLISYNQKYDPKVITAHDEFMVVGRVL